MVVSNGRQIRLTPPSVLPRRSPPRARRGDVRLRHVRRPGVRHAVHGDTRVAHMARVRPPRARHAQGTPRGRPQPAPRPLGSRLRGGGRIRPPRRRRRRVPSAHRRRHRRRRRGPRHAPADARARHGRRALRTHRQHRRALGLQLPGAKQGFSQRPPERDKDPQQVRGAPPAQRLADISRARAHARVPPVLRRYVRAEGPHTARLRSIVMR